MVNTLIQIWGIQESKFHNHEGNNLSFVGVCMVQRVRKGIVYIFLADKMQSIIELQISRKTPSSPAANSSSLCCHCGSETHTVFFPFPAPRQLHLSSLPEKVWNRLEVGPQNKKLWQAVKPVWNTHTTVGPKRETKSSKSIL